MKLILVTPSPEEAEVRKNLLLRVVDSGEVETWSRRDNDPHGRNIVYHNPPQYTQSPEKNVHFLVTSSGEKVVFEASNSKEGHTHSREMKLLHCGRLAELLFTLFGGEVLQLRFMPDKE